MAIALDASASGHDDTNASPHSVTISHTLGSGANRAVIVCVAAETGTNGTDCDITGVTYNGVAMTEGSTRLVNAAGLSSECSSVFYILDASLPAGGTYNVVATATSALSSVLQIAAVVYSLTGVAQSAQPDANTGSTSTTGASSYSTSITTVAANSWAFDALADGNQAGTPSANAGQANAITVNCAGQNSSLMASTKAVAVAGSSSVGYTSISPNYNRVAHSLLSLSPAATTISGTLAVTDASDTSAASGGVGATGTLAVTDATDASTAAGAPGSAGTLAQTDATDTSAASGAPGAAATSTPGGSYPDYEAEYQARLQRDDEEIMVLM